MKPRKYRKKPVEVEVMGPLTDSNLEDVAEWSGAVVSPPGLFYRGDLGDIGDFVVIERCCSLPPLHTTVKFIRPDIFEATYEPVEDE